MGGRGSGRKPAPLALKVFRGGRVQNHRTPPELAAGAIAALPKPPAFLKPKETGQAIYKSDGEQLVAMGVLTAADVNDWGLVCLAWERVQALIQEADGPATVMDDNGVVKVSPALGELRRWLPLLRSMRSDYGLSGPRSRMMPTTTDALEKATNPLDAFKKSMG